MSRLLPLPVLALVFAAGCRSEAANVGAPVRPVLVTADASPPAAAPAAAAAPSDPAPAAGKCCPGGPAPAVPAAATVEPEDSGVLAPLGSATAIDCPGLGSDAHLEILPVEVLPADAAGGKPAVACTVRLTRKGAGAIGTGSAWRRDAKDKSLDVEGVWTTGPGVAWTGNVPCGETVYLHFKEPEGERIAPYGWYVDLSFAPAGEGHVRIRVDGSAPI